MRRSLSTAAALALLILLTPVAALACEGLCLPEAVATDLASAPKADAPCHRPEAASGATVSLRASFHDCVTHQPVATRPARLTHTRAGDAVPVALVAQPRAIDHLGLGVVAPLSARAFAPPGPPSGLLTPLRI